MSDVSSSISIGGVIDEAGRRALAAAVVAERVGWDWPGPSIDDEEEVYEALLAMVGQSGTIDFYDEESRDGRMPQIEAACREHGLHYALHREPDAGDDGDVVFWIPGMEEPRIVPSDADGKPVVVAERLLADVEAAVASGTDALTALREQVAAVTIPHIPSIDSSGDNS